jgi:hypothetical protein
MSEEQKEQFMYNGRNRDSRRLADWWERHQEWDARRVAEEKTSRRNIMLRGRALNKLTIEEREALGL